MRPQEYQWLERLPLRNVVAQYGTPTYLYDAARIKAQYHALEKVFADAKVRVHIHYALKANSNQAILTLLGRLGAGVDVVSQGEAMRACKADIASEDIVFSGVGKTLEELHFAFAARIGQLNCESAHELEQIATLAQEYKKPMRVAIRVNPDVAAGTHAKITTGTKENKFGIPMDLAQELFHRYQSHEFLQVDAVAVHIGSQLVSLEPYAKCFAKIRAFVQQLRAADITINQIDFGGGLGVATAGNDGLDTEAYGALVAENFADLNIALLCEPGRYLVAEAGILLVRVILSKQGGDKQFIITDGAMNDLIRPTLYEAHHTIVPLDMPRGPNLPSDIVGPVCESGDYLAMNRAMPKLPDGSILAVLGAGAYGSVMASTYNTRPLLAEVLVYGEKIACIRPRMGLEELIARDNVPEWL
ncbi:MAG: diaminopimelate decarboxylase [Pseudomonadota bacterium]